MADYNSKNKIIKSYIFHFLYKEKGKGGRKNEFYKY